MGLLYLSSMLNKTQWKKNILIFFCRPLPHISYLYGKLGKHVDLSILFILLSHSLVYYAQQDRYKIALHEIAAQSLQTYKNLFDILQHEVYLSRLLNIRNKSELEK